MSFDIRDMSGKFLIASPDLEDPNFKQSVVLVCEHSKEGAFGLIINRILMNSFAPLLKVFDIKKSLVDLPVYFGGPVKPEQGYVIYSPFQKRYGAIRISKDLAVTASKEILSDIAGGKGPESCIFALGFAGWSSSQLEEELMMDSWIISPADLNVIYTVPVSERWRQAALNIGIDFERFISRSCSA